MQLKKVHVHQFQSIRDSNEFEVGDVTCLVGKNEAGKTALLQAIYRVNPVIAADAGYSVTDDYPRRDVEDYLKGQEADAAAPARVAKLTFRLDEDDIKAVESQFGKDVLTSKEFSVSKSYEQDGRSFWLTTNDSVALKNLVAKFDFPAAVKKALSDCDSFDALQACLGEAEQTDGVAKLATIAAAVVEAESLDKYVFSRILWPRAPKFLYFDEYYQMVGAANVEQLQARQEAGQLEKSDHPLLGLINLARLSLADLLNPSRTRELKNTLEGAGNHLTKTVVKYWSQNRYLQLRFDVRPGMSGDPAGMQSGTNIWGDVYDTKHMVTTELGTRSKGFVWFFSFLAWYSDILREKKPVILLLDEPGLSLHARAQGDLLRYFDDEVKGNHQVIYTTHSPFLVDPLNFDRVRIVQDLSIETDKEIPPEKEGTKVLTDVLDATPDSLFPLQGALGYEVYQTLFIGPRNLVVEGVSDLLYLQAMTTVLTASGRTGLDPSWTITPVGGSDKVPTFVALIGAQGKLKVATLIDFQKKDKQMIDNLWKRKLMKKKNTLTFADFCTGDEADIEDLFEPTFYLSLVNSEFASELKKPVKATDIAGGSPRVLIRLEQHFQKQPPKGGFNHFRPARYFSENLGSLQAKIPAPTLDRFEKAFKAVNALT